MKNILKTEVWKSTHNPMFYAALCIGLFFCAIDFGINVSLAWNYLYHTRPYRLSNGVLWGLGDAKGMSVFYNWICAEEKDFYHVLFWFALPLLASFSYGWADLLEKKNGYRNQYLIRASKGKVLLSKFLSVFFSGGVVVMIPVLLNFMLTAMVMPLTKPIITNESSGMLQTQFGSLLFYERPYLFVLLSLFLIFLWGGTFGVMSLAVSSVVRSRIVAVILPFILCALMEVLYMTNNIQTSVEWSPRYLFHLMTIRGTSGIIIFGEIFGITVLSFLIFLGRGKRDEIL